MNNYDSLTKIYKRLQDKTLSAYIETDKSKQYHVTDKEQHISFYSCNSKENAIQFCRELNINIIGFINHKI